ncbi:MAG: response regulator [Verrucomicrobia bacterium]|nr:response regulator [Verrucomicrobiota bacterium]
MKEKRSIGDLQADRARARRPFSLPDLMASADAPPFLKSLDPDFVQKLLQGAALPWGDEGLYPEAARLIAAVQHSEEGQRLCLEADIRQIHELQEKGEDHLFRSPLGCVEAVFPVRLRGLAVHCVWSGKMRDRPFSEEEKKLVAALSGQPPSEMEALVAAVPVLTRSQIERTLAFCRRLRDSLEQALDLQLRVAELTQQLLQSERTQSVGTLSGGVAHHFNNLLSVILGYSSFVVNRESLSREAAAALHKIAEAAQRGRRLTEEILAFLGSESEEVKPCGVHDTLRQVLSLLESQTGTAIRVRTRLEAKRDIVLSVPSSIHQIVFNLLTHAIDSMPGGGWMEVSTSNMKIEDEVGAREFLQLDVVDLVDPGLAGPRAAPAGGARKSLKLSSAYGMVGRLEGSMVISEEGEAGSRVRVLLPVIVPGRAPPAETKTARRLTPRLIWVVDDDPIFREMCRQVLSDSGHTVKELDSGPVFRERWREEGPRPDLIILDFSMPECNGLQLCEWLKAEGATVPVILVSGFAATQPDIRKALRLKRTYFLQKPFSFREMIDVVTVALGETLIGE